MLNLSELKVLEAEAKKLEQENEKHKLEILSELKSIPKEELINSLVNEPKKLGFWFKLKRTLFGI